MKVNNTIHSICVGLVSLGLLFPNLAVVRGAETVSVKPARPTIIDVSLAESGVLRGQVVSPSGQVLANAPIAVQQGQNVIAKTATDKDGRFALPGLKGGVYVVSTDGAAGMVRAWSPRTAPPTSVESVLLVPQTATTRAQLVGDGATMNLGLGALLVGGMAAAVIAISIDHNSAS